MKYILFINVYIIICICNAGILDYRIGLAWWIFVLAGMIALFVSLLTVSTQAVKAA